MKHPSLPCPGRGGGEGRIAGEGVTFLVSWAHPFSMNHSVHRMCVRKPTVSFRTSPLDLGVAGPKG